MREECYAKVDVFFFCVAVVVALYRDITMICLHDVSMIAIGAAGAAQEQEEPSLHHVAHECPYLINRHIVNAVRYLIIFLLLRVEDALQALELLDSVLIY